MKAPKILWIFIIFGISFMGMGSSCAQNGGSILDTFTGGRDSTSEYMKRPTEPQDPAIFPTGTYYSKEDYTKYAYRLKIRRNPRLGNSFTVEIPYEFKGSDTEWIGFDCFQNGYMLICPLDGDDDAAELVRERNNGKNVPVMVKNVAKNMVTLELPSGYASFLSGSGGGIMYSSQPYIKK